MAATKFSKPIDNEIAELTKSHSQIATVYDGRVQFPDNSQTVRCCNVGKVWHASGVVVIAKTFSGQSILTIPSGSYPTVYSYGVAFLADTGKAIPCYVTPTGYINIYVSTPLEVGKGLDISVMWMQA